MTTIRKIVPSDVMEELDQLAEAHIEKAAVSKQRLSREQAMVEAIGNRPDLYARYEKERLEGRYARQEERPWPEEKHRMLELIRIAEIKTVAEGGDAGWGWW
jgi:hypothetical protein